MKNLYKLGLLIAAFLPISCSDILEENPRMVVSNSNFFKTETDCRNATDAIYHAFQNGQSFSIYGAYWPTIDVGTDDIVTRDNNNSDEWMTHTIVPEMVFLTNRNQYQYFWKAVSRANDVIKYVPTASISDIKKNVFLGEAHALRAFAYYNLVRVWGDMPKVVNSVESTTDFDLPRSSVDEIYNEIIIPDLKFAEENCVNTLHSGRVTKWTAKLILAEVYLTRAGWRRTSQGEKVKGDASNWALARDKAKEIIDGSPHSLITTAVVNGQNITPACGVPWIESKPYSVESMFELGTISIGQTGAWLSRPGSSSNNGAGYWGVRATTIPTGYTSNIRDLAWPAAISGALNSNAGFVPSPDLYAAYDEAGDQRRDWLIVTKYITPAGKTILSQPSIRKYMDIDFFLGTSTATFQYTNNNIILYRFADALLIYAEAQNEADGAPNADAYTALNRIRRRAFGVTNTSKDLSGLTQAAFRTAVYKERRLELAGEIKRRFDLIRTDGFFNVNDGTLIKVWASSYNGNFSVNANHGNVKWPDREWLLPIPLTEMNLNISNGWVQNKGYAPNE
ncbi:RagB/SusD family nutrient uptake outer membrane protein [Flavobacterium sp. NG2]|uniref:RagB/SusD family nutrient uptake outer membrane protein n=1 Tax=Flavobacterium sp. NG2 TaxID=3097547 RepID=UPI002A7EAD93|nr:RagB/SusD family nutrient uptake outer membrane protein [Flavobacterium sp. NG2]WPR73182.1 RagB/SusD family nutrient uptake outer membrane protein [Flavobacterium sp. NG2]